jgi:hypothetical protein
MSLVSLEKLIQNSLFNEYREETEQKVMEIREKI